MESVVFLYVKGFGSEGLVRSDQHTCLVFWICWSFAVNLKRKIKILLRKSEKMKEEYRLSGSTYMFLRLYQNGSFYATKSALCYNTFYPPG